MLIVSQQYKKYTLKSRREAENPVTEPQRPIAHAAKEIVVSAGLMGRWVTLARKYRRASSYRECSSVPSADGSEASLNDKDFGIKIRFVTVPSTN